MVEKEFVRSHSRGELGVRVQTSNLSDTTADEAITNVTMEEAFNTGIIDKGLLRGVENASIYEADIRIISVMKMDYELLEEIIEDLAEHDSKILKQYLVERRIMKKIVIDEDRTYEAIRKRIERIKADIHEEIIDCLQMNCWDFGTSCQVSTK